MSPRRIATAVFCAAALAACDKAKDLPNPLGGSAPSGPVSPVATIDSYKAAIAGQDWVKLYGLLSVEFQKQAEAEVSSLKRDLAGSDESAKSAARKRIESRGMSADAFAKEDNSTLVMKWVGAEVMSGSARLPREIKETKAIRLDDTKASVTFLDPGGKEGTLRFVKQNGAWRFAP